MHNFLVAVSHTLRKQAATYCVIYHKTVADKRVHYTLLHIQYRVRRAQTLSRLRLYSIQYCLKTDVANIMDNKSSDDDFCTQIQVRE